MVDLDTELQYFIRLIREMRITATERIGQIDDQIVLASEKKLTSLKRERLSVVKELTELSRMLERAVSMDSRLTKDKKARQKKLTPSEYLEGVAKYILAQPTVVRNAWLTEVVRKHLERRSIETGSAPGVALEMLVAQDEERKRNEN